MNMEDNEAMGGEGRIQTQSVTIWKEDGILFCKYIKGLHVTLEIAKQSVETRFSLQKGEICRLLVDMRGIKSVTREAREYLGTVGASRMKAGALIVGSFLNSSIGNVFLLFEKPPVPVKLFRNREKAVEWLKSYA